MTGMELILGTTGTYPTNIYLHMHIFCILRNYSLEFFSNYMLNSWVSNAGFITVRGINEGHILTLHRYGFLSEKNTKFWARGFHLKQFCQAILLHWFGWRQMLLPNSKFIDVNIRQGKHLDAEEIIHWHFAPPLYILQPSTKNCHSVTLSLSWLNSTQRCSNNV